MRIKTTIPMEAVRGEIKTVVPIGRYNLVGVLLKPEMRDGFLFTDDGFRGIFVGELFFSLLEKSKLIIKINN